jgi:hypothetical protein
LKQEWKNHHGKTADHDSIAGRDSSQELSRSFQKFIALPERLWRRVSIGLKAQHPEPAQNHRQRLLIFYLG